MGLEDEKSIHVRNFTPSTGVKQKLHTHQCLIYILMYYYNNKSPSEGAKQKFHTHINI